MFTATRLFKNMKLTKTTYNRLKRYLNLPYATTFKRI